jgi:hypothetical protein
MKFDEPIKSQDWREKYEKPDEKKSSFRLENSADDSVLNRMVKVKILDKPTMVEGEVGKLYFDRSTSRLLFYLDKTTGWVGISTDSNLILQSPDGTDYRIKVANGGALSTEEVT